MKEIDYFFEWMSASEVAEDFGISEKRALAVVKERGMRTQVTRHGEFQIFGEDLKAWYEELRSGGVEEKGSDGATDSDCGAEGKTKSEKRKRKREPPDAGLMPRYERTASKGTPWGERTVWIWEEEAAERLGLSLETTRRMFREGMFWARKRKGKWQAALQLIERYLDWKREAPDRWKFYREQERWKQESGIPRGYRTYEENYQLSIINDQLSTGEEESVDIWISSREAMGILQIQNAHLHALAKKGVLVREITCRHGTARFRLKEVLDYEALREARAAKRRIPAEQWKMQMRHPLVRSKVEAPPGDRLITRKEAAGILGVSVGRVQDLNEMGILFAWQKEIGKHGSRVYLSENQVRRYSEHPERLKHRRIWERGGFTIMTTGWEEQDLQPIHLRERTPAVEKDHGEFYTTRQAALVLGVCVAQVGLMRKRMRLNGYRLALKNGQMATRKWWFYRKEDVHSLKHDPEHVRARERYLRAQTPEARAERELKALRAFFAGKEVDSADPKLESPSSQCHWLPPTDPRRFQPMRYKDGRPIW